MTSSIPLFCALALLTAPAAALAEDTRKVFVMDRCEPEIGALELIGAHDHVGHASTPVSAAQPDANARRARKTSAKPVACVSG